MSLPRLLAVITASSLVVGWSAHARADQPTPDAPVLPPAAAPAPISVADGRPKTGRFVVGAGHDPDEGFIARAALSQDRLFGTADRLSLSGELSARRQAFRLEHAHPDLLGTGLELRTELFNTSLAHHGLTRAGAGGAATLVQHLGPHTETYLRYQIEDVRVDLGRPERAMRAGPAPGSVLGDGVIASLTAGIRHDTLDDHAAPRRGTRLELYGETATRPLGSEHAFVRVGGHLDHARPLGPLTLRVHGRGAYQRSRDGGSLPLSERLQHDGHADVRGYAVGTLDAPVWLGDHLVAGGADGEAQGQVELELPVWPRIGLSVVGFADAGLRYNADPAWGPTGTTVARSVGAGLLWRSPIGPLRFDWALPFDSNDQRPQFLFSMAGQF